MKEKQRKTNYRKVFAIKAEREKRIQSICPGIPYDSGIYVFHREDDTGIKRAYCGQAVSLCERCASHLAEYDHIALSLKSHGFYSETNIYGWKLSFKLYPKNELDQHEIATIKALADKGYQLYNVTAGGQGVGKKQLREYKPAKGYYDGILQGKKSLVKELNHIIETHLEVKLKYEKHTNKVSIKALEKFNDLLNEENYERS